jgi:ABC-type antimicrobial peptide transport system permease subunit
MVLHARVDQTSDARLAAIRARVRSLDPDVPVTVRRLEDHETVGMALTRSLRGLLAAAALVGLLIASVGVFGVVAYAAARRTREMAIRRALGATEARVMGLSVREAVQWSGMGLVGAMVLVPVVGAALQALLYGVGPADPVTLGVVVAIVGTVTLAASWLPARRAMRRAHIVDMLRDV